MKEQRINEMKNLIINDNEYEIKKDKYYECAFDFYNENKNIYVSPKFNVDKYEWEIEFYIDENGFSKFEMYLYSNIEDEYININGVFFIRNSNDFSCYKAKSWSGIQCLNNNNNKVECNQFLEKSDLFKKTSHSNKAFISNNKFVVGVYFQIYENDIEELKLPKIKMKEKISKSKESDKKLKNSSIVIATNDFIATEYDQLDIKKDEFLVVTDWDRQEGWVYGHRKDNSKEKGLFPKVFICEFNNDSNNDIKGSRGSLNEITPEYRINFENKVKQFKSHKKMEILDANTDIVVNRNNLFEDSYNIIMSKTPMDLKKRIRVKFEGEEGLDAGGLTRDFFYQLSKEIGNPNYSLFQYNHENSYLLEINPKSGSFLPDHLNYFKFIGRIIGMAIFHTQYLAITFTIQFFKRLLDKPLEFSDLEYMDSDMYKNLNWLMENEGAENLCLTFEIDCVDCFGNHQNIELKPNGSEIEVTDENKKEYIDLVIKNKLTNSNDEEQMNAIKQGFYEIIPKELISEFNELDLNLLICGINEIDVNDWESNTDYEGYNKDDVTIINFWKFVRELNYEKRTRLLIFATGNSQIPVTGFKDLRGSGQIQHFKLKKIGTEDDLPKSHTCFNRIDLPPYSSYTQLKQKMLLAISEGLGAFSME